MSHSACRTADRLSDECLLVADFIRRSLNQREVCGTVCGPSPTGAVQQSLVSESLGLSQVIRLAFSKGKIK